MLPPGRASAHSVLVTWLNRDGALTYCSDGHSNRSGGRGGPESSRSWAFPPAELGPPIGQVTSPKGCGVLIGWLHALGERAGTVSIYREAGMVTLARGGKKQERKRKEVWQDHCPLVRFSCFNVCLPGRRRERRPFLAPRTKPGPVLKGHRLERVEGSGSWGIYT